MLHLGLCPGVLECWQLFFWVPNKGPSISCGAGCPAHQIGLGDSRDDSFLQNKDEKVDQTYAFPFTGVNTFMPFIKTSLR